MVYPVQGKGFRRLLRRVWSQDEGEEEVSFATRTRETLKKGEEQRGDFAPKAGSAPARMYNYWLRNSSSKKAASIASGSRRENFCHYWRVVAIWAPLRALFNVGERVVTNPILWVAVGIAAVAFLVYGFIAISGFGLAILQGIRIVAAAAAVIGLIFATVWFLVEILPDKFPRFSASVEKFFRSGKTWLTAGVLALAFAVWLTSHGTGGTGYIVWACIGAALAVGGFAVVKLIDYENGRQAQRQAEWDALDFDTQDEILEWNSALRNVRRKPSALELKIRGFFRGVGEAAVFVVQVVRVNKWKICPLVEIPKEK